MKYIVILGDGMADYPVEQLSFKTPLEAAKKPNIDRLTSKGTVGFVRTVPTNLSPGSDVANLSVLGYDPNKYYTGRSSLEAVSMGINLKTNDTSFRCNLVTLSDEENYIDKTMVDYSSDEISSQESHELIKDIQDTLGSEFFEFFPGISYRHCLISNKEFEGVKLTPPHDISKRKITNYLPQNNNSEILFDLMKKSHEILKNHPININRIKNNLHPANSIWLWGEGKKPLLPSFHSKYGINGSVISAVDLIKGIGICANLNVIDVEGATGNIHTNFTGKALAALKALQTDDFVYLHIEAPDECGHRQEIENKVKSIEYIDEKVVSTLIDGLEKLEEDYKILILPDHATPLSLMTHTLDIVPFVIYEKNNEKQSNIFSYNENDCKKSDLYFDNGYDLLDYFILGK